MGYSLRSQTAKEWQQTTATDPKVPTHALPPILRPKNETTIPVVVTLPKSLPLKITGLDRRSNSLLRFKRAKLRLPDTQLRRFSKEATALEDINSLHMAQSVGSSLVFAQEEAGTAVCVSPQGLLLTCSHCIADDEQNALAPIPRWLIFASGEVVQATCIAWDPRRDLALLCVVAAEPPVSDGKLADDTEPRTAGRTFPCSTLAVAGHRLENKTPLICVGHPGSEDLEVETPGVQTGYDVLHISEGSYRGLQRGQDLHDNSQIGALKHDCWTYWGHSGAPLFDRATGNLVGLHSSWDDQSGMRRGIPIDAIWAFLKEHTTVVVRE